MFSLSANEGWAFLIAAACGLVWPAFVASLRRPDVANEESGLGWKLLSLAWPLFYLTLNWPKWSGERLFPLWAATFVALTLSGLWVLVFGQLSKRRAWAKAWLDFPLGRFAGLLAIVTLMLWVVDAIHRHGVPWLTPSNIAIAISAVGGLLVGSTIPAILMETGLAGWVGRHVISRVSPFHVAMVLVLTACGFVALLGVLSVLHR